MSTATPSKESPTRRCTTCRRAGAVARGRWWRRATGRNHADRRAYAAWVAYRERFGRTPDVTFLALGGGRRAWLVLAKLMREAVHTGEPVSDEHLFPRLGRVTPAEFIRQEQERLGPDWVIDI